MRPDFRIEADGFDVTARLRDRLVDIKVTDERGLKSDRLEIALDDRDAVLPLPRDGAKLKVWLGYRGKAGWEPAYMGRYTFDEVEFSNGPRSLIIRAKATESAGALRRPKTRSWDGTIGSLVKAIAGENGLIPKVAPELAGIPIGHLDQTEESDSALLTRVAEMNGAVVKPANGALLFLPRGEGKTATGQPIPVVTLTPKDVTKWRVVRKMAKSASITGVETFYQNHGEGEPVSVKVGSGPNWKKNRLPFQSEDEARRAAEAELKKSAAAEASLDITLPGRPDLFAEGSLRLTEFRRGVDGLWSIERVEHSYKKSGGYSLSVSADLGAAKKTEEDE